MSYFKAASIGVLLMAEAEQIAWVGTFYRGG
jgi:hypothetical protein